MGNSITENIGGVEEYKEDVEDQLELLAKLKEKYSDTNDRSDIFTNRKKLVRLRDISHMEFTINSNIHYLKYFGRNL